MATATKETKKVPVQSVTYRNADDGVTLRLDQKEAVVLLALVRNVGGRSDISVRAQTDAISRALQSAGVLVLDYKDVGSIFGKSGGVYPPNGSGKVLDEILARKESNAKLVEANQAMGQKQAGQASSVPTTRTLVDDVYAKAAADIRKDVGHVVGTSRALYADFAALTPKSYY